MTWLGSNPLVGSSSNNKLCGIKTKLAKATLAFSPPDKCPTNLNDFSPVNPNAPYQSYKYNIRI